jgi:hypothetical protein
VVFLQIFFDVFVGGDRGDSQQGEPPQPGEGFEEHHCLIVYCMSAASSPASVFFWGKTNTLLLLSNVTGYN